MHGTSFAISVGRRWCYWNPLHLSHTCFKAESNLKIRSDPVHFWPFPMMQASNHDLFQRLTTLTASNFLLICNKNFSICNLPALPHPISGHCPEESGSVFSLFAEDSKVFTFLSLLLKLNKFSQVLPDILCCSSLILLVVFYWTHFSKPTSCTWSPKLYRILSG